jgi:hypothetical protein
LEHVQAQRGGVFDDVSASRRLNMTYANAAAGSALAGQVYVPPTGSVKEPVGMPIKN